MLKEREELLVGDVDHVAVVSHTPDLQTAFDRRADLEIAFRFHALTGPELVPTFGTLKVGDDREAPRGLDERSRIEAGHRSVRSAQGGDVIVVRLPEELEAVARRGSLGLVKTRDVVIHDVGR